MLKQNVHKLIKERDCFIYAYSILTYHITVRISIISKCYTYIYMYTSVSYDTSTQFYFFSWKYNEVYLAS